MPRSKKKDHSKFYVEEMPEFLDFTVDGTWMRSPVSALLMELNDTLVAVQGVGGSHALRRSRSLSPTWLKALIRRLEEDKLEGASSAKVAKMAENHCFQKEEALLYENHLKSGASDHMFDTRMLIREWQSEYDQIQETLKKKGFSDNLFGQLLVATMVAKERAWRRDNTDLWHPFLQASETLAKMSHNPVEGLASVVEELEDRVKRWGMENKTTGYPARIALTFIRNQMLA